MTDKQEYFCQSRANGLNKSQSYLSAYLKSQNWTKETVYARSSELEKKPKIQQRIEELRKPARDLLEQHRNEIIKTAIDIALGKSTKKVDTVILNKMLDKLLPTKTENKNEVQHVFNIKFDV